jgi:GT2 family glycosyltransferase
VPEPPKPRISVIIACVNGLPMIVETLSALERQTLTEPSEIIVLDRTGDQARWAISQNFPNCKLIALDETLSIPELRARGLAIAQGEIVVMLEDHCVTQQDWLARLSALHRRLPHAAISGCVENGATKRAIDWAHYLCDYIAFAAPLDAGETTQIAGNCASYKRAALNATEVPNEPPRWEYFVHRRLIKRGYRLYCDPSLSVAHKISFTFREVIRQRYYFSRSFGAMRCEAQPGLRSLQTILGSPLIPFLILFRVSRHVLQKRRYLRELIRAFPVIFLLAAAAGIGELVGALAGENGSTVKVR